MLKITTTDELKKAIFQLEEQQSQQGRLLKEQLLSAVEDLRPGNIMKRSFSRLTASPDFKSGLAATALGLAAFYLTGKTVSASSRNPLKKMFGRLLQVGISNLITQHPNAVKSIGRTIIGSVLGKIRQRRPDKERS